MLIATLDFLGERVPIAERLIEHIHFRRGKLARRHLAFEEEIQFGKCPATWLNRVCQYVFLTKSEDKLTSGTRKYE